MFNEFDIYCGLRNKREFFAMQNTGVFDYCIWVDRSDHLPPESKDSMSLEQWMSDYTIDNNGDIDELEFNVCSLIDHIEFKDRGLGHLDANGLPHPVGLFDS